MPAPIANTAAAAIIAEIAVRTKLHTRNDPNAETACLNDVIKAVNESAEFLGVQVDYAAAVIIAGKPLGMKIRETVSGYAVTYT